MPHIGAEQGRPQRVRSEIERLVVGPPQPGVRGGDARGEEGAGQHLSSAVYAMCGGAGRRLVSPLTNQLVNQ